MFANIIVVANLDLIVYFGAATDASDTKGGPVDTHIATDFHVVIDLYRPELVL